VTTLDQRARRPQGRARPPGRPDSGPVLGSTTPRIWTRPLVVGEPGPCGCGCALTEHSSLGFQAIRFASDVLRVRLWPWQRWWLIHALELRPDSSFRFRVILTLVARQQGKTWLLKVLSLWAMYLGHVQLVLGAAQSLDIADESWKGAVELAQSTPALAEEVASIIRGNGKTCLTLVKRSRTTGQVVPDEMGPRYRTVAATPSAGRGLSVGLLILDELREHRDWAAWASLTKTTIAQLNALTVLISNAGEDRSVVLNATRESALAAMEDPDADDSIALMEWSAPDGCDLDDELALACACPTLNLPGSGFTTRVAAGMRAVEPPGVYRTEVLCQRVSALDPPLDPIAWANCVDHSGSLVTVREQVCVVVDVAEDGGHAVLAGAAVLGDGRIRVETMAAWNDVETMRRELPELIERIRPLDMGWYPSGGSAAYGAEFRSLRLRTRRALAKVVGERGERHVQEYDEDELTRLVAGMEREAAMGFSAKVRAGRILRSPDPLMTAHGAAAVKIPRPGGWTFGRTDGGHVTAVRAAAGAAYLAQLAPPAAPMPRSAVF